MIGATALALHAFEACLVVFSPAFGPPTSESAGLAAVLVAILYLWAIRRRFHLEILR